MNHFWNIVKKELRELLTFSSIMSIVMVVIILMSLGTLMGSEIEKSTSASPLGIINGDAGGEYSDFSVEWIEDNYTGDLYFFGGEYTEENIINQMKSAGINSAIGFPKGYSQSIIDNVKNQEENKFATIEEYFILSEGGGIFSMSSSIATMTVISGVSSAISIELIKNLENESGIDNLNPVVIHNPVGISKDNSYTYINGTVYNGITPMEISSATTSQNMMIPFIIMIIIMTIGGIVISSMGNEKENKTLETLLTVPVKRTTIVSGKLIACAITGLIFGIAYMFGMYSYMSGMMGSASSINLADYGLGLTNMDWIITGIMVFMSILCALGICMIMGAFVKNYKSAQTMTLPIAVLAMIPMFVTMFSSWDALPTILQSILFAIPFTHPMMVIPNLTFGNDMLVIAGLVYLIIFTLVTLYITVKLYNSDILITGLGQNKFVKHVKRIVLKKKC